MTWVSVGVGLALAVVGGAVSYENTKSTQKHADNALADQITNQSIKQREADAKVNNEVTKLEGSTSEDERAKRLNDYMDTVRQNRSKIEGGLTPAFGSDAFRTDAANDAAKSTQYAGDTASLLSRIDAANLQRQDEGFSYGNLATDLGLIGRQASGQNWLDDLRVKRASQSNATRDALAKFLVGAGSAVAGGAGAGAAGGASGGATGDVAIGFNSYGVG